jgi:hypothetical protein
MKITTFISSINFLILFIQKLKYIEIHNTLKDYGEVQSFQIL